MLHASQHPTQLGNTITNRSTVFWDGSPGEGTEWGVLVGRSNRVRCQYPVFLHHQTPFGALCNSVALVNMSRVSCLPDWGTLLDMEKAGKQATCGLQCIRSHLHQDELHLKTTNKTGIWKHLSQCHTFPLKSPPEASWWQASATRGGQIMCQGCMHTKSSLVSPSSLTLYQRPVVYFLQHWGWNWTWEHIVLHPQVLLSWDHVSLNCPSCPWSCDPSASVPTFYYILDKSPWNTCDKV